MSDEKEQDININIQQSNYNIIKIVMLVIVFFSTIVQGIPCIRSREQSVDPHHYNQDPERSLKILYEKNWISEIKKFEVKVQMSGTHLYCTRSQEENLNIHAISAHLFTLIGHSEEHNYSRAVPIKLTHHIFYSFFFQQSKNCGKQQSASLQLLLDRSYF